MARQTYEIGALYRGELRRFCMTHNLTYREDKGLLDSFFVVDGPQVYLDAIKASIQKMHNDEAAEARKEAEAELERRRNRRWYQFWIKRLPRAKPNRRNESS